MGYFISVNLISFNTVCRLQFNDGNEALKTRKLFLGRNNNSDIILYTVQTVFNNNFRFCSKLLLNLNENILNF